MHMGRGQNSGGTGNDTGNGATTRGASTRGAASPPVEPPHETLRRQRGQQLLTRGILRSLPPIGSTASNGDPFAVKARVKFFAKGGLWDHFYATEFDGEDLLFGCFVKHDKKPEHGYISFAEMEKSTIRMTMQTAAGQQIGAGARTPNVERDQHWTPASLREVMKLDGHTAPAPPEDDDE